MMYVLQVALCRWKNKAWTEFYYELPCSGEGRRDGEGEGVVGAGQEEDAQPIKEAP